MGWEAVAAGAKGVGRASVLSARVAADATPFALRNLGGVTRPGILRLLRLKARFLRIPFFNTLRIRSDLQWRTRTRLIVFDDRFGINNRDSPGALSCPF